jgi:hypothetical protein
MGKRITSGRGTTRQKNEKKGTKTHSETATTSSPAKNKSTTGFPAHLWQLPTVTATTAFSPKRQRLKIQSLHPDYTSIWVIRNFLDPLQECPAWIRLAESDAAAWPWQYVAQQGTRYMASRECHRMHREDPDTAERIYQRLVTCCGDNNDLENLVLNYFGASSWKLTGCNPNLRLYKYEKGMAFGKHIDESNILTNGGVTKMTVLIYLSECGGGATRFVGDHTVSSPEIAFSPQAGAMLLHVHGDDCLVHEADPVTSGIKYVLRTDLVLARV